MYFIIRRLRHIICRRCTIVSMHRRKCGSYFSCRMPVFGISSHRCMMLLHRMRKWRSLLFCFRPIVRWMPRRAGALGGMMRTSGIFFMTNILTSMISPMFLISVFWSRTIFFLPSRMRGCVCSVGRERRNSRRSQSFAIFPTQHREHIFFCKLRFRWMEFFPI